VSCLIYCYAECHYAECRYAEYCGALVTSVKSFIIQATDKKLTKTAVYHNSLKNKWQKEVEPIRYNWKFK